MKADPEKAKYWMQHIEALKMSGLSRKAYCEQNGLNKHTMDSWCQKLNPSLGRNAEGNKATWIPLQIKGDETSGIDLRIGKITIAVKPGFDQKLLTDLLRTLAAAC
jgi:hypothetical protein